MRTIFTIALLCCVLHYAIAQSCSSCNSSGWTLTIPAGQSKTYSVPSLSGATYVWTVTGGLSIVSGQGTTQITINPTTSGQLCVTRYKTGSTACADCAQLNIVQPPAIPSSLSLIANNCNSVTATVGAVSGATSYKWYHDNTYLASSTSTSITLSFTSYPSLLNGTQKLCVEAINQFGVPSASKLCKVFTGCTPPPPDNMTIEFDGCKTLTATIPYVAQATNFNWYIDGVFFRMTLPNHGKTSSLIINLVDYPYLVSGTGKGAIVHDLCVESVDAYGIASATKKCESFSKRCEPDTPTLTSVVVENCQSIICSSTAVYTSYYNWYIDGTFYSKFTSNEKVLTLSIPITSNLALKSGQHTFCIEAVNEFGVSNQSCKTISVSCETGGGGSGGGGVGCELEGVFDVFPNPVSNEISITSNDPAVSYTVELLDYNGNKVTKVASISVKTNLSMTSLRDGQYYVIVTSEGCTLMRKVILER